MDGKLDPTKLDKILLLFDVRLLWPLYPFHQASCQSLYT
jgi:hypothetical protein